MTGHLYHAPIPSHGLADGCPRCDEIAGDPIGQLDDGSLLDLVSRFEEGEPARSDAEAAAFHAIETTLRAVARLQRVTSVDGLDVTGYLARSGR